MDIKQIYSFLGKDDAIIKIALLTGIVHTLRCINFAEAPLSSVCCAILIALIYALFAKLILYITPDFLKPIISLLLIFSMFYYIFLKKHCAKIITMDNGKTYIVD